MIIRMQVRVRTTESPLAEMSMEVEKVEISTFHFCLVELPP